MPETMVKTVARAIKMATAQNWTGPHLPFDEMARAALQALREPTEAMEEAAKPYGICMSALDDAWRAMIDAALSEGAER